MAVPSEQEPEFDEQGLRSMRSAQMLLEDDTGVKLIRAELGIKAVISRWDAKKFLRRSESVLENIEFVSGCMAATFGRFLMLPGSWRSSFSYSFSHSAAGSTSQEVLVRTTHGCAHGCNM